MSNNGNTSIKEFRDYARSDQIVERFAEIVGERNARAYITSVVIAVGNSPSLQKCSNQSIMSAALQAASLRLSCDPQLRQAALVPFKDKAVLIPMAKGLYDLAIRTGKYRYIHVHQFHGGEGVEFDPFTGAPKLVGYSSNGDPRTGWMATFQMYDGYSKTIYMSVAEIHEHAKKYSPGYNRTDGLWKTNPEAMERKTILRRLLTRWGYMDPSDVAVLGEIDDHEFVEAEDQAGYIDAEFEDAPSRPADVIIGEIVGEAPKGDGPPEPVEHTAPTPRKAPAKKGTEPKPAPNILEWMVSEGYAENDFAARGIFALLKFETNGDAADRMDRVRLYRAWREAGADANAAAVRTLAGELPEPEAA